MEKKKVIIVSEDQGFLQGFMKLLKMRKNPGRHGEDPKGPQSGDVNDTDGNKSSKGDIQSVDSGEKKW